MVCSEPYGLSAGFSYVLDKDVPQALDSTALLFRDKSCYVIGRAGSAGKEFKDFWTEVLVTAGARCGRHLSSA